MKFKTWCETKSKNSWVVGIGNTVAFKTSTKPQGENDPTIQQCNIVANNLISHGVGKTEKELEVIKCQVSLFRGTTKQVTLRYAIDDLMNNVLPEEKLAKEDVKDEVQKAMLTLRKAFIADPDFAYTWHCNIAMACYDVLPWKDRKRAHKVGNTAATNFMKKCFDVSTKYMGL